MGSEGLNVPTGALGHSAVVLCCAAGGFGWVRVEWRVSLFQAGSALSSGVDACVGFVLAVGRRPRNVSVCLVSVALSSA